MRVPSYDLDLKLAEMKINGYVIFEELFPVETIDRIRAAFMPVMEQVREKTRGLDPDLPRPERQVFIHGRSDERLVLQGQIQNLNRYTVYVPWEQPFADPAMYEHPVVLEFLERYWETTEYHVTCYHSNVPYPGSDYQGWHRDIPLLVPHVGLSTCPHLGFKIPLVDTSEENGSFEVMLSRRVRSTAPIRSFKAGTTRFWRRATSPTGAASTCGRAPAGCRTRAPSTGAPRTVRIIRARSW